MGQIRTIDNQRHNVKETKEELDQIMNAAENAGTRIVHVNWQVSLTSMREGYEQNEYRYEPACFIIQNIMMYY